MVEWGQIFNWGQQQKSRQDTEQNVVVKNVVNSSVVIEEASSSSIESRLQNIEIGIIGVLGIILLICIVATVVFCMIKFRALCKARRSKNEARFAHRLNNAMISFRRKETAQQAQQA